MPFEPFPFLLDSHHQTFISAFFSFGRDGLSERQLISLPDGDKISDRDHNACDLEMERSERFDAPWGLRIAPIPLLSAPLQSADWKEMRSIRMNLRGCGSGKGARKISLPRRQKRGRQHTKAFRKNTSNAHSDHRIFSWGKYRFKTRRRTEHLSPRIPRRCNCDQSPVDLYSSVQIIGDPANSGYERYFYRSLAERPLSA